MNIQILAIHAGELDAEASALLVKVLGWRHLGCRWLQLCCHILNPAQADIVSEVHYPSASCMQ